MRGTRAPKRVTVKVVRLAHSEGLALPDYQSESAAGMDLVAAVPQRRPLTLKPGERVLVPSGLIFQIPVGFEGQVRPRSGLAFKHGITVLNSPGTIDADYRGELGVLLINLSDTAFKIARGERIAQLVIAPVTHAKLKEVRGLSETKRGGGGFGSTGVKTKKKALKTARKTASKKVLRRRKS